MIFSRTLIYTVILFHFSFNAYSSSSHRNHQQNHPDFSTGEIGLSLQTIVVHLDRVKQSESNYEREMKELIKAFEKKIPYSPRRLSETLHRETSIQKKILEKKIKEANNEVEQLVSAFQEYNRSLVITLNRSDYKEVIQLYQELQNNEYIARRRYISELQSNPMNHLFDINEKIISRQNSRFKYIYKIKDQIQKIRKTRLRQD